MSKKSGLSVFALSLLAGAVIFYGMKHAESEQEKMVQARKPETTVAADSVETDQTNADPSVADLDLSRLSLEQYLHHKAETNGEAHLTVYGDTSLDRSSLSTWAAELKELTGERVVVEDMTYPGVDTYELYIQQTTAGMADTSSDAILFFLPAYPDKDRDMGLEETEQYLQSLISRIQTASPDSLLIFVEPHPMGGEAAAWNSRSLGYARYLEKMKEVVTAEGLPVFELHDAFALEAESQSLALESLRTESGMELNADGEALYAQIFNEWTEKELDTSSYVD